MNAVIVDDEYNALTYLKNNLEQYEYIEILETFTDSCKALSYLIRNPCDLLFLDVEMPNINGVYIAEQVVLLHPQTKICFITAHHDYAVKAFELNALDYIQKPFSPERLTQCLNRIQQPQQNMVPNYQTLNNEIPYKLDIICGYEDENIVLLNTRDIYYFETVNGVVFIHTKDNVYRGNKPLNFYEEKLNTQYFFKTHKCYLINLSKADHFSPRINYTYDMYFKNLKDKVPVSRNKVKELKKFFS